MNSDYQDQQSIRCYITAPFSCSYLTGQEAQNLVIDPHYPLSNSLLGNLLSIGFRRSGNHLYRPQCKYCQECISLRIPVEQFKPNRSQQRNWKKNKHLQHKATKAAFNPEQFSIYRDYLLGRHPGSSMSHTSKEEYLDFLTAREINTTFHEFRQNGQIQAVAVTDHTSQGLSAVYTFYNPDAADRGLGTYAILWQIQHAKELGIPWLYLGYWIKESEKMAYKAQFNPCQGYIGGQWRPLEK